MSDNSPTPPPKEDSENSRSPSPTRDNNDASSPPPKEDNKNERTDDNDVKKDSNSVSIYVGNLSYQTNEAELEELFKPLGTILNTKITRSGARNSSRGYGFITVADRETADKMIDKLNGTQFDGRKISVEIARGSSKNRRQPPRRDRYSRDRDRDRYSRRDRYDRRRRSSYDDYSPRRSRHYDYDDYSPRRDDYDDRSYRSDRKRRGRYD